jgi:drug/metabolite transporter (DMT)-like permease
VAVNKPPFPSDMERKEQAMLVFRGVVGFANILASYYSLRYLDIGDQKMVASSRPVWVIMFSRLFLKEKCGVL